MDLPQDPLQTFGIELEFLCLRPTVLPPNISTSQPGSDTVVDAILDALVRRGVPSSDHNFTCINDGLPPYSQWRIEEEHLDLTPAEQALLPHGWMMESVELASRKFFHALEHWHNEIAAVLDALRELETYFPVKFITNRSAGLHVHVGDFAGSPMPFRAAKNVLLFATAYESLLDTLHPAPRVAIPWTIDKRDTHYCYPLSFFAAKRNLGAKFYDRLHTIEQMPNYAALGASFVVSAEELGAWPGTTGHNASINFDNLCPQLDEEGNVQYLGTKTLEFRQHAATLDYDAIVSWIEFTTALVRFCTDAARTPEGMKHFAVCLSEATHPNTTIVDHVLDPTRMLNVLPFARQYYRDRLSSASGPPPPPFWLPAHAPLLPLLGENAAANAADASRDAVAASVAEKMAHGDYGHDGRFVPAAGEVAALWERKEGLLADVLEELAIAQEVCGAQAAGEAEVEDEEAEGR